jgi:hypothetical protein
MPKISQHGASFRWKSFFLITFDGHCWWPQVLVSVSTTLMNKMAFPRATFPYPVRTLDSMHMIFKLVESNISSSPLANECPFQI